MGGVAASWARVFATGALSAVGAPHLVWPAAILGIAAAVAFRAYQRAIDDRALVWRTLLLGALLFQLVAVFAMPLTSNDIWSNIAYGRLVTDGLSPYLSGPAALPAADAVRAQVDPLWADVPMTYGPVIAAVCALVGRFGDLIGNYVVFKLLMLAATLASLGVVAALCRTYYADAEARTRFVCVAWCPLIAWELAGQAHNDAILVLALLGFVWAAMHERAWLAAACLAVGIASKFVAAPVAGLYLVAMARRSPLRALALALVVGVVCVALVLPWWHGADTFQGLWTLLAPSSGRTSRSILDLIVNIASVFGEPARASAYRVGAAACLLLSAGVGITGVVRTRTVGDAIHYGMLFLLVNDLASLAWFQPWYVLWLFPLALVHPDVRWLRLVATYAALTLVAYVLPIDPVTNVAVDIYIGLRAIAQLRSGHASLRGERASR